jgi:cob(I)alamin adenosyltransferase
MRDPCSQHEPDAALILRAALAPHFMTLRRLLSQMGGLILLSRGRQSDTWDGIAVSLGALGTDVRDVQDGLARAAQSLGGRTLSQHRMREAAAHIEEAIAEMEQSILPARAANASGDEDRRAVLRRLQRAQRALLSVADERTGFVMVGFSHACCCSGAGRGRICA